MSAWLFILMTIQQYLYLCLRGLIGIYTYQKLIIGLITKNIYVIITFQYISKNRRFFLYEKVITRPHYFPGII